VDIASRDSCVYEHVLHELSKWVEVTAAGDSGAEAEVGVTALASLPRSLIAQAPAAEYCLFEVQWILRQSGKLLRP
jgi:hypothetical protein